MLGLGVLGSMDGFPLPYAPRLEIIRGVWDGKLGDGTYAPAGQYRLVVRALHILGDPNKESDYDSVESQMFRIRYSKLLGKRQEAKRQEADVQCDDVGRKR